MAKTKTKSKSKAKGGELTGSVRWEHGQMLTLPIEDIEPNEWNPNEMTTEEFNMLSENIDDVDFLDPILVVPLAREDGERQRFRIVDGEHRYEQQRLMDVEQIKCVVADPERFDETTQKFQTVRMNKIRGSLNRAKFTQLVDDLMKKGGYELSEISHELGFTDSDEFESLLIAARDSLPSEEMQQEFDKVKDEIRTVDDLSAVLNRLFTRYGDTLPYHFMVLDFGGKDHVWVRMRQSHLKRVREVARECYLQNCTFDSFIYMLLDSANVPDLVAQRREVLDEPDELGDTIDMTDPSQGEIAEDVLDEDII